MKTLGNQIMKLVNIRFSISTLIFILGAILIFIAWITSYPVEIPPLGEYVFDRINPVLWPGLSMVFTGLYLTSTTFKKQQFIYAMIFVFTLYIHYMLFPLIPGSDSHYFRGLTNYFSNVGINPSLHKYFQWPAFFIINNFLISILGLNVDVASKLFFIVIGFVITIALFLIYSFQGELGFIGVALYFMGLFYFINYQYAPQSLALALFLVFVSQVIEENRHSMSLFLLFIGLLLTHSFFPMYLLLFLLFLVLFKKWPIWELVLYTATYVIYVIFFAIIYFEDIIKALSNILVAFQKEHEYAYIVQRTIQSSPVSQFDAVAQLFSRCIILSIWALISLGFIYIMLKKKIDPYSLALFLSGLTHFTIGSIFNVLGVRSLQVIFISLVSGVKPFIEKYGKIAKTFLLLIFLLFPLVIVHSIYDFRLVQTTSGERASNILLEHVGGFIRIFATPTDAYYIYGNLQMGSVDVMCPQFIQLNQLNQSLAKKYNFIIYNPSLERDFLYALGLNHDQIYYFKKYFLLNYDKVWDDGYSQLLYLSQ